MIFTVEISELLTRSITLEATSKENAEDIVRKKYNNECIVLNDNDLIETKFTSIKNNI